MGIVSLEIQTYMLLDEAPHYSSIRVVDSVEDLIDLALHPVDMRIGNVQLTIFSPDCMGVLKSITAMDMDLITEYITESRLPPSWAYFSHGSWGDIHYSEKVTMGVGVDTRIALLLEELSKHFGSGVECYFHVTGDWV